MCHGSDVAHEVRAEAVDEMSAIGYARFLRTNPQKVGIIDIDALDADDFLDPLVVVDVTWLNIFGCVRILVHLDKSQLIGTNPDVSVLIACHTVDITIHTDAC